MACEPVSVPCGGSKKTMRAIYLLRAAAPAPGAPVFVFYPHRMRFPRSHAAILTGLMMAAATDADDRLRAAVQPVLALSEAELLALIPERAGLRFTGCPNCDGGTQENQLAWTIERPREVHCRFCGIRYPNDTYPDGDTLRVTNPLGEVQEYPYWSDADGYRHYFRAKAWFEAREYFARRALDLGRLHAATGDRLFARRAALILSRFAEVYPGYCVHYDYPFRQKIIFEGDRTFPWPVADYRAAKWDWWAYMDIPEDLLQAYELVRPSGALDEAAQRRIEQDLFHASVDFVRSYPPALGNMDPTLLRGLITAGRVLKEPEYIHDAVRRIELLARRQFFADGTWREGAVSYHNQTVRGLDILARLLKGWTDPPGYVPEEGEDRLVDFDLDARLPILARAREVPGLLRYPNGRVVAFHDTWAREAAEALPASESMLLPALGHARLGRGAGGGQVQAHLHFSGGYGHQHGDVLAMTLFSHGRERLGDIGYTHTRYRRWTITTLSHNTVTVDGRDQHMGSVSQPSDGDLRIFVPGDGDMLAAVEASGERSYPGLVDEYRRLLLLIGANDQSYVVDWFRVSGGSRHEYVLTGDADHGGDLVHDLETSPYGEMLLPPGTPVSLPTGESTPGEAGGHNLGYAFIRGVEQAAVDGPWRVGFHSSGSDAGVRVHGAGLPGDRLFTAVAPSIRNAAEDDAALDEHTMPMLVHRREGEDLRSDFVTVLESHGAGGPFVREVSRLPVEGDGVALRIAWGEVVDHVLLSRGGGRVRADGVSLDGRLGFVRRRGGEIEEMRLVGGRELRAGGEALSGAGVLTGGITGVLRREAGDDVDALITDLAVPEGVALEGLWAVVRDGAGFRRGHRIERAETRPGGTLLVLADDPGYELSGSGGRLVFFPGREWTGPSTVEIATLSALSRRPGR